jgi:hypothetical protein
MPAARTTATRAMIKANSVVLTVVILMIFSTSFVDCTKRVTSASGCELRRGLVSRIGSNGLSSASADCGPKRKIRGLPHLEEGGALRVVTIYDHMTVYGHRESLATATLPAWA